MEIKELHDKLEEMEKLIREVHTLLMQHRGLFEVAENLAKQGSRMTAPFQRRKL